MRPGTLPIGLALVFACAVDSPAQFTPVIAKVRVSEYRTQPEGSERSKILSEGFYYRSSAGDIMQTRFGITARGTRRDLGRSTYYNASERKHYSIDHNIKLAELEYQSKRSIPPSVFTDEDSVRNALGEETVQGLRCVIIPIKRANGEITGKVWLALNIPLLRVKTERTHNNIRRIWELYDIRFTEPDSSKFSIPSDYEVDPSKCRGCENSPPELDPLR